MIRVTHFRFYIVLGFGLVFISNLSKIVFREKVRNLDYSKSFSEYLDLLKSTLNIVRYEDYSPSLQRAIVYAFFNFTKFSHVFDDFTLLNEVNRFHIKLMHTLTVCGRKKHAFSLDRTEKRSHFGFHRDFHEYK